MRKIMDRVRKPQPLIKSAPNTSSQPESNQNAKPIDNPIETPHATEEPQDPNSISLSIAKNLQRLHQIFEESADVATREFEVGTEATIHAFIVFINGLVDQGAVNLNLINPLMNLDRNLEDMDTMALIKERALSIANVRATHSFADVVDAVLSGDTVLFIDNSRTALIASLRKSEKRTVDEPKTESVVRGPREGFVESLETNIALLRKKMRNPALKFFTIKIGRETQTEVCVAYLKGIAKDKVVEEVKQRLQRIDTDAILESGYIESFIEDAPLSLFPTVGNTEKPDIVSAKLLEGRVAILVDGTPFVLTVPYLFVEGFQNSEDYYSRPYYATFIRWLRWLGFFFATFAPGLYVAITTYHQEFLPPALLASIAAAQEGTPFPTMVEALLMQTLFEILREAGVRLPRPVGPAVSIVGALVIGDAAISAGLVGAPMVVITALTAISSFVTPSLTDVGTLSRFSFILAAGVSGLYGVMLAFVGLLTHQVSLRSLGAPYMSPLAPSTISDLKDVLIRAPQWFSLTRPRVIGVNNPNRQKPNQMPSPPDDQKGKK
ncbi:MAG TPA: spore germination protein [Desulfitobacterium dehalogenans]|uniref:Spore germination protein n=1 Tax=Desulfitobacterium dehalogenans TaxID=36854 RepID=A0A7C7D7Z2_9FIRM|nr:spore germination protein [Desulfitobacterium dehalogenans]